MRKTLLDLLICPLCLPAEKPLRASCREQHDDDVVTATLRCPACRSDYQVCDGLATLLAPRAGSDAYATPQRLTTYLWSHYAEFEGDPDAHQAYPAWAELLAGCGGPALDTGCAVGRLSFELARHADPVIGIDLSAVFIEAARRLAREGRLEYALVSEGELTETRSVTLPVELPRERVEFLVADAMALPFPASLFATVTSLNLLDRVPAPQRHLAELNRVARCAAATLLVADPWSWAESPAPGGAWLGGRLSGANRGHARDNLRRQLKAVRPHPWHVHTAGRVDWTLRNHRNHFELIRSDFLLARR